MLFDAHGSFDLSVRGDIFILRFEGAWNLERAKSFFKVYQALILEKAFQRFGVLSDFRALEGATPDCIAYFEEVTFWARERGQIARAQIVDSDLKAFIADKGTRQKDIFPIRSFEDENEALAWLATLGLKIS